MDASPAVLCDLHMQFFLSTLQSLPENYVSLDTSRVTALYFCVVATDILTGGAAAETLAGVPGGAALSLKERIIDYVYAMQVLPDTNPNLISCGGSSSYCGFVGSPFLGEAYNPGGCCGASPLLQGNLAMTYTSIAILTSLGDDLSRLHRSDIIEGLRACQQTNGSFSSTAVDSEADMRFLYCAVAISYFLNDFSGLDIDATTSYIQSCVSYEGGIGLMPHSESHGGSTYCAIAALELLGRLGDLQGPGLLASWLQHRQVGVGGFNGRTNKDADSCYSFWVGASLCILGLFETTDREQAVHFLLHECQNVEHGGFSKVPNGVPDILHSFYSLCYLAMAGAIEGKRKKFNPTLAICC